MPIRPVDIVKTPDVAQYRQAQTQRAQHEQVHINKNFNDMVREEISKPVETLKADNREFRYDAKEESRNSYSGKGSKKRRDKDKKKGDQGSDDNNKTGGARGIDILI
ncbi:MAG: hypothetical protein GX237_05335 [Clostridiales bacterium]|nr:hypothetical protein [Clostridiales bacterium]